MAPQNEAILLKEINKLERQAYGKFQRLFDKGWKLLNAGERKEADATFVEAAAILDEVTPQLVQLSKEAEKAGLIEYFENNAKENLDKIRQIREIIANDIGEKGEASNPAAPNSIHIEPTSPDSFKQKHSVNVWAKKLLAKGFVSCGDYKVLEFDWSVRAFFQAPGAWAIIVETPDRVRWLEIAIYNADDTTEIFTNAITNLVPDAPWATYTILPGASIDELYECCETRRSAKERMTFSANQFEKVFCETHTRYDQWRKSKEEESKSRKKTSPIKTSEGEMSSGLFSPLKIKLSDEQRKALSFTMCVNDGFLTFEEIHERSDEEHPLLPLAQERSEKYPEIPLEYAVADRISDLLCGFCNLIERGIVRRIVRNDPTELAKHLSLDSRYRSFELDSSPDKVNPFDVWYLLKGISTGDSLFVQKISEKAKYPAKGGDRGTVLLYNGVVAGLNKEVQAIKKLVPELQKSKPPRWMAAMHLCLIGIAEDSPELVAQGIRETVAAHGRRDLSSAELIICLDAHGLYEFCRRISPKLVSLVDINMPFPWDSAYCDYVRNCDDPLRDVSFERISPMFHQWIATLNKPQIEVNFSEDLKKWEEFSKQFTAALEEKLPEVLEGIADKLNANLQEKEKK